MVMAVQTRIAKEPKSWSGCVTLLKSQHRPPKIRLSTGVQLSDCPKHSATTTLSEAPDQSFDIKRVEA